MISIIVPTLNEEAAIARTLAALSALAGGHEILVVDGGSTDATIELASESGARVLETPRGRGTQMHAGAMAARGDVLWFVHADTIPSPSALVEIERALADARVAGGNFTLLFDGPTRSARQLTAIYPRLRRLGLSYGDAGIFVRRTAYDEAGGFRPYPLFEDLDLIRRIKRCGRFVHLACPLTTSSRRFEQRNFAGMWVQWIGLQLLYWIGVSPHRLARWYRHAR